MSQSTIDKAGSLEGKRVLIRVDFNVPQDENLEVTDFTRIKATVPTIQKIIELGGRIVLMSHLGRPKGKPSDSLSLRHLIKTITTVYQKPIKFSPDCIGTKAEELSHGLKKGEILLLENLRFHPGEEAGDLHFAQLLARLGDVYVNDAFGTAHRVHASTTVVAKFFVENKYFGLLLAKEIENIRKIIEKPQRPVTAIIGGAKVSSKIEIIKNLLHNVDNLIVGGGMNFTFCKALGYSVGNSLVEDDKLEIAKKIIQEAKTKNVNLALARDFKIADNFSNEARSNFCKLEKIPNGWMGLDVGKETIQYFSDIIKQSKTILWNGPLGVFEFKNFRNGTQKISAALVEATQRGAFTFVGGGDSVAALNLFKHAEKVSYISTGGGALLEMLEGITLPGIKAIEE